MDEHLTPLQRFFLAFVAFILVLVNRRFAEEVALVRARQRAGLPPSRPEGFERVPAGEQTVEARREAERAETPEPPPSPEPAPVPSPIPSPIPEPGPGPTSEPTRPEEATTSPSAEPATVRPPPPPATEVAPAVAEPTPTPVPAPAAEIPTVLAVPPPPAVPQLPDHAEALHVLALLQRDGRLLDFLSESLEGFKDSEIGAAARTVHAGCRKVLESYLDVEPVFREPEGAQVTVEPGFDPASVRLTGNVVGSPPFRGSLRHHGWRAVRAAFPPPPTSQDVRILAPAEVEL